MCNRKPFVTLFVTGSLVLGPLVGCESAPGNKKQQGAVVGGVGGALAGAAVSKDNRGLGALIGGALGAGGGYLVGSKMENDDKNKDRRREDALRSNDRAKSNPATVADVNRARTADLNDDGFVTLDEVVAQQKAGLSDRDQIARLERTGQVFELTGEQERYLQDHGVSRDVIREMRTLNQQSFDRARTASDVDRGNERIGTERINRTPTDRLDDGVRR